MIWQRTLFTLFLLVYQALLNKTKGISLFIVPKFNVNADGSIADRNGVRCGSIEHKMGIHGNATCVINFDNAKGFLIGPENKGLHCMFTFMNTARIGTAVQGLTASESSFQGALTYAKDRLAMRSLSFKITRERSRSNHRSPCCTQHAHDAKSIC